MSRANEDNATLPRQCAGVAVLHAANVPSRRRPRRKSLHVRGERASGGSYQSETTRLRRHDFYANAPNCILYASAHFLLQTAHPARYNWNVLQE